MSTGTTTTVTTGNQCVPSQNSQRLFATSSSQLLLDLHRAYRDARKHKRSKSYQVRFEQNSEYELVKLRDEILSGRYHPGRSKCFVIHDPKMREVFAANFRDRIVHHLLYNYIAPFLEKGFIADSYSCITGRGTHYGISRLERHIKEVSCNYSRPCYILKLDVKGYFMHIDRRRLLNICMESLRPFRMQIDYELVKYLLEEIVLYNPLENCDLIGSVHDWDNLPKDKSLFHSPVGCGLPIGNLTSQLFSNVYMNVFDQYMTSGLGCLHYGRYVDDAYIVGSDKEELWNLVPLASGFLANSLGLSLNQRKTTVYSAYRGVEFIGAYLKPFRKYVSSSSLRRIERNLKISGSMLSCEQINSYLGLTSHYSAYNIRHRWQEYQLNPFYSKGYFTSHLLKAATL